jgi:hypothetical protein
MVAGASSSRTERRLREWQTAMQVAQHFNDLLMRLRSFGLPLLVTVGAVGFAFSLDRRVEQVPNWAAGAILSVNAVLMLAVVVLLLPREGWGRPSEEARDYPIKGGLEFWEKVMWCLPPVFAAATAVSYWLLVPFRPINLTEKEACSAGVPVLVFGLTVLVVLYALDRFYYYKLLLGAVNRSSELEKQLSFTLTDTITALTAPKQSATIVTLIYFLPGIAAYAILLILLVVNPTITR